MNIKIYLPLLTTILILLSACQQTSEPRVCRSYIAPPPNDSQYADKNLSKFKAKTELK